MAGAARRTVRDIRADLFARTQALPLRFFDRRAHGDLMSRLTNDVENINLVLTDSATQLDFRRPGDGRRRGGDVLAQPDPGARQHRGRSASSP